MTFLRDLVKVPFGVGNLEKDKVVFDYLKNYYTNNNCPQNSFINQLRETTEIVEELVRKIINLCRLISRDELNSSFYKNILYKVLVKELFCITPTSVPAESLFSVAGILNLNYNFYENSQNISFEITIISLKSPIFFIPLRTGGILVQVYPIDCTFNRINDIILINISINFIKFIQKFIINFDKIVKLTPSVPRECKFFDTFMDVGYGQDKPVHYTDGFFRSFGRSAKRSNFWTVKINGPNDRPPKSWPVFCRPVYFRPFILALKKKDRLADWPYDRTFKGCPANADTVTKVLYLRLRIYKILSNNINKGLFDVKIIYLQS
ncbi:hypothetical protein BpHYR1_000221 [Brachionus plicatilis]|uniref:Uncharacterized protein n=1 Tax=Brachionus plicatilis TaxID=10195 RepID=A0A3M7R4H0_BRAPC|nr:hypothetical protein BpHYR1_000221 [Brachionus plicatilis]